MKPKKLKGSAIPSLHVIPTKHLYYKYALIILLVVFATISSVRIYDVVTNPHVCTIGTVQPINYEPTRYSETDRLVNKLVSVYRVARPIAIQIVNTATIYSNPTFPTVYDTLAIIAIESSFNTTATASGSSAKGLMQVLYKRTSFSIEQNISDGVALLIDYREQLKSEDAVVQAYNRGIGNYLAGDRNPDYLNNFKRERQRLKE